MTATQAESVTHLPGPVSNTTIRVDKPQASFRILGPDRAVVGTEFTLTVDIIQGPPQFTVSTDGPCTPTGGTSYLPEAEGRCRFTVNLGSSPDFLPAPTQTIDVPVGLPRVEISFEVISPAEVLTSIQWTATANGGGDVSVTYVNGPCEFDAEVGWFGIAGGQCIFRATQAPSSTHQTATPVERTVTISKAAGSYQPIWPAEVEVGAVFVVDHAPFPEGGQVTVTLLSGPCTSLGGNSYSADDDGDCNFRFSQAETNQSNPAPDQDVTVRVRVTQPGSFLMAAPDSVEAGKQFGVAISDVLGGPVAIQVSGACTYDSAGTTGDLTIHVIRTSDSTNGRCYITASQAAIDGWTGSSQATDVGVYWLF
ncbi:MAG: hypothetical protein AAF547_04490 [Actinomycetota bacterium]